MRAAHIHIEKGFSMPLTPDHKAYLEAAAIDVHKFAEGLDSTSNGILFRLTGVSGRTLEQVRPDQPGDGPKYLTASGQDRVLPVPPHKHFRYAVGQTSRPIVFVEGTKGHLAAASALDPHEYAVVGLMGCTGGFKGGKAYPDLTGIPLEGRDVYLILDADMNTNRQVWEAAREFRDYVETEGGVIRFVSLFGGTSSIDDLLAERPAEQRRDYILRQLRNAKDRLGRAPDWPRSQAVARGRLRSQWSADQVIASKPMLLGQDLGVAVYRDGRYHTSNTLMLDHEILKLLGDDFTVQFSDVIHRVVKAKLEAAGQVLPEFTDKMLVPFSNGLLDPMSGELHPHTPEFRATRQFQVAWDPEATCPRYDQWIRERVAQPGCDVDHIVQVLHEAASQMFDLTNPPVKGLLLFGPSRSGKGTFTDLLEATVGAEGKSAVSLHALSDNRFATATLYGKTLNVFSDLSAKEVTDLSMLKLALGEDLIRAEHKNGKPFHFRNTATIVFSANEIPPVSEASQAYFNRMIPVEFPHTYAGAEDRSVRDGLLAELPGIAVRLVEALRTRITRGLWLPVDPVTDAKFRNKSDRVSEFISEHYDTIPPETGGPRGFRGRGLAASEVYAEYRVWCRETGTRELGRNRFYERVRNLGVVERLRSGWKWLFLAPKQTSTTGGDGSPEGVVSAGSLEESGEKPEVSVGAKQDEGNLVSSFNLPFKTQPSNLLTFKGKLSKKSQNSSAPSMTPGSSDADVVAVDTETDADPVAPTARLVSAATHGQAGVVLAQDAFPGAPWRVSGETSTVVGHNLLGYDWPVLARAGAQVELGQCIDTLVLSRLVWPTVRPGNPSHSLGAVAERLGLDGKTGDLSVLARKYHGYGNIPADDPEYVEYARRDAVLHLEVYQGLVDLVPDAEYAEREMQVARAAARMRARGMLVDPTRLQDRIEDGERADQEVRDRLRRMGVEVGKRLSRDGKYAAARAMGVDFPAGKDGAPLLNKDTLKGVDHPVAQDLLALNGSRGLAVQVRKFMHPDHRIRASIDISAQATGRWSVTAPGMTTFGKGAGGDRDLFVPSPGHVLCAIDLSQIDVRGMAALSQDQAMIAALQPGQDWHRNTAEMLLGSRSDAARAQAKALSHAINYSAGVKSVAQSAGVSQDQAQQVLDNIARSFPGLVRYRNSVVERSKVTHVLENGWGRRVAIEQDYEVTQAPGRTGQSWARDAAMECLLRLWASELGQYVIMHVHDEFVFEFPRDRAEDLRAQAVEVMTFTTHGVPVLCEAGPLADDWEGCYE